VIVSWFVKKKNIHLIQKKEDDGVRNEDSIDLISKKYNTNNKEVYLKK
jgi:hypothetical protein